MPSVIESYFSVLMLFGFSHAILGIWLLVKDKQKPFSNNILALLLFAWGFSCYWFFAFIVKGPFFSVSLTTFIGPMLALTLFPPVFLYVKYLFYEYDHFQKADHLHFIPIYIYLLFTFYLFYDSNFSIVDMRKHEWYKIRRVVCDYIATIQGPFYFIKTNHVLQLRHQKLKANYSEIESRKLQWFRNINYSFALVFIIGGISTILRSNLIDPFFLYMGYHVVLAIGIFSITLKIYKYPMLFTNDKNVFLIDKEHDGIPEDSAHTAVGFSQIPNEHQSVKEQLILSKIEEVMREQKLYKNPNLSLNDLAEAISESRNSISAALNNGCNKTFYNYVNELRIEESKHLLRCEKMLHFSVEGIAAQSGFKTMSVFYKLFKDIEETTPSVYRKAHNNK
ncbi:MAG: hypothetical protein BGO40_05150 [Chryseobacterium sp. 39-10]|nr:AraC family transcriptional regulator [Chryseobacterium sp.]OJV47368.1 MAG: hypothetical protein BGO40_05150 [Chryseobacterium sp. 39-10]